MAQNRLVEDELDRQENERDNRMNIIGQNGNDGEHYTLNSGCYKLNVNNIHDIEDIKDIFEGMGLVINVYGDADKIQQRLIDKGLFE